MKMRKNIFKTNSHVAEFRFFETKWNKFEDNYGKIFEYF